jgi:hypothetical protein
MRLQNDLKWGRLQVVQRFAGLPLHIFSFFTSCGWVAGATVAMSRIILTQQSYHVF